MSVDDVRLLVKFDVLERISVRNRKVFEIAEIYFVIEQIDS